jgi:hypothetical protein
MIQLSILKFVLSPGQNVKAILQSYNGRFFKRFYKVIENRGIENK